MSFLREIYKDSLLKNSIFLMVTNLLNLILGFFFWIIVARYYTPDEVGINSALLSSMFLISMIGTLGFHTAIIYYLPRDRKNASKMINSCLTSSIAASLVLAFIFVIGLDIWAPPLKSTLNTIESGILFVVVTIVWTISGHISSALIAGRKSSLYMTKEMVFGFIKILPLAVFSVFGAIGVFMAWGTGLMFAMILGFFLLSLVWKGYSPAISLDPIIKTMAGYSAGNYLADILNSLPRLLLPLIILNLVSTESTGFFFIALMVASLLNGIPKSISTSLLAESSESGELWYKVKKSIKLNTALLFPGILFFVFFGKFVLNLFNPLYAQNASDTLIILAITSLPFSVNTMFMAVRNAQKKVTSVIKINAAIAAITLAFSFPLLKIFGIEGAGIAYLAANTLAAIVVVYNMKKPMNSKPS